MISVIILTFNEEIHLERCLKSILKISNDIIILDSYSTDKTLDIAQSYNASIYQNKFVNQSIQLNWALNNCKFSNDWILRLDADEYLTLDLQDEIINKIPFLSQDVNGIILKRRLHFLGKWIKYGGNYPIQILRIWKINTCYVENKNMDEHIYIKYGKTIIFNYDFVDQNLNNIITWSYKHLNYANRELIDYQDSNFNSQKSIYYKLPILIRPFLYFFYRYFIRFGFLDGFPGLIWHVLQGFWYRFIIDVLILQKKYYTK